MGCRKKVVHILPVPILFLHSCFSIFTCSAFKLQNNLRLSTFILYNSDADLVINKLLGNPKPRASLLPGGGMTCSGWYTVNSSLLGIPPSCLGCVINGTLSDPQRSDGMSWRNGRREKNNTESTCGVPDWLIPVNTAKVSGLPYLGCSKLLRHPSQRLTSIAHVALLFLLLWLFRSGISPQSTEPCPLWVHSDTSC